jgi:hypothetical protein
MGKTTGGSMNTEFELGQTIFRHGDVHVKVSDKEADSPEIAQALLHKGQNHHHNLRGLFKMQENAGKKYLTILEPTELYHEEHATLLLEPGMYTVDIQIEYDHWLEESRQVID